MTREQVQTEIDHIGKQIDVKHFELAIAEGALQAFTYMLKQMDVPPTAPAAPSPEVGA